MLALLVLYREDPMRLIAGITFAQLIRKRNSEVVG